MFRRITCLLPLIVLFGCTRPRDGAHASRLDLMKPSPDAQRIDSTFVCPRPAHNVTAEFDDLFYSQSISNDPKAANALRDCDVVLVHGWLGEVALRLTGFLNFFSPNQHALDYLKDQRQASRELGMECKVPLYRSESIDACGEKVARFIAANPRPVILIGHSKGGLDALAALLSLQRSGQLHKVAGWLAMQGPFYGCDEAQEFFDTPHLRARMKFALFGGKLDGLRDLTPAARRDYMAQHEAEIATLMRTVPVVCFGSWLPPKAPDVPLMDGPVKPGDAILPGADYVAKCGVRHALPVLGWGPERFDRVAFTKTMLIMLAHRMADTH